MSEFNGSKVYYFQKVMNRSDAGRGEHLRLFLLDSGIPFEYLRHTSPEWSGVESNLLEEGHRLVNMPYLVAPSGKVYSQTAPLMRYIGKKLGRYVPHDPEDEFLIDAYADIILDWRTAWVTQIVFGLGDLAKYEAKYRVGQLSHFDAILGDRQGPYLLGQEITYADFIFYSILKDDLGLQIDSKKYPNVIKFIKSFEARPSLVGKLVI